MDHIRLSDLLADGDLIDFGDVPAAVNSLLQQGVALYYDNRPRADGCFREAMAAAPECLPVYFRLYKIHTYQRNLDDAEAAALAGLAEAARQSGVSDQGWERLTADDAPWTTDGPARFYLYTLKALAFIRLRQDRLADARALLAKVRELDPEDAVGASVVAALADRLEETAAQVISIPARRWA